MVYVKGRMPFTQIVETAPAQVSTTKRISHSCLHFKYPESSVPTGTLTGLTRYEPGYGVGDGGPLDLQATDGRVFHVNWYRVARLRSCT